MLTLSIHYLIITLKVADGIGANIRKIYEIEKTNKQKTIKNHFSVFFYLG